MTLIEIMVVVIILGMMAVALSAGLFGKVAQANREIARIQLRELHDHVALYKQYNKEYPSPAEGLAVLTNPIARADASYYVEPSKLEDPWGHTIQLLVPGPAGQPFEVVSYGADGAPGGSGENADLSSTRDAPEQ
ncbi:MAG: type II secretion system protein GspG [Planctomycetota bacterium]